MVARRLARRRRQPAGGARSARVGKSHAAASIARSVKPAGARGAGGAGAATRRRRVVHALASCARGHRADSSRSSGATTSRHHRSDPRRTASCAILGPRLEHFVSRHAAVLADIRRASSIIGAHPSRGHGRAPSSGARDDARASRSVIARTTCASADPSTISTPRRRPRARRKGGARPSRRRSRPHGALNLGAARVVGGPGRRAARPPRPRRRHADDGRAAPRGRGPAVAERRDPRQPRAPSTIAAR